MAKNECESELENLRKDLKDMTEDRDRLRRSVHQQREDILDLRRQLERNEMFARVFGGSFQTIDTEIDRIQRERDTYQKALAEMKRRYARLELILDPQLRQAINDYLMSLSDDALEEAGGGKLSVQRAPLQIAYMVVVSSDEDEQPWIVRGWSWYFDSLKAFMGTVPERLQALVLKAPMLEDMCGPYLEAFGISHEQQLEAIQALSLYQYDEKLKTQFQEQLDEVWRTLLKPHCPVGTEDEARNRFRKSVKATFGNVAKNRQIKNIPPKLTSGRPKK